jgi:hypothetical protein
MKIEIRTHYAKDDPDCISDYCSVELFVDDNLVKTYGDAYHDDGRIKARAFAEGIVFGHRPAHFQEGEPEVEETQVADYDV